MSNLTSGLDSLDPPWEADDTIAYWVEQLKAEGIIVGEEQAGKERRSAVSFSGFYSQGDGLAFDCVIEWPAFLAANPSFAEKLPNWWALLFFNPETIYGGTTRHSRGNNMYCSLEWQGSAPDKVEHGIFAGETMYEDDMRFDDSALESYVLDVCRDRANKMYRALEADYDEACEYEKQQRIEEIIASNLEPLQLILGELLLLGSTITAGALDAVFQDREEIWGDEEGIDAHDLQELGLIKRAGPGERGSWCWQVTAAGKEVVYEGLKGMLNAGYLRSNGDKTYRVTPEGLKFIGD